MGYSELGIYEGGKNGMPLRSSKFFIMLAGDLQILSGFDKPIPATRPTSFGKLLIIALAVRPTLKIAISNQWAVLPAIRFKACSNTG